MTTTIPQIERVIYTAKARTMSDPDGGASRTTDGRLSVRLSPPGSPGNGTNPAQLLAAGWSACLLSTLKHVADKSKTELPPNVAIEAEVDAAVADGGVVFQARMNVQLPGVVPDVAARLVQLAERDCPISKAVRGNVNAVITFSDPSDAATAEF